MDNVDKKLAYGLWAVIGVYVLLSIIYGSRDIYSIIFLIIPLVFQSLLGYTILRKKNDKFTRISVILAAIFTFTPGCLVAFILRLILRKKDSKKIRNAWFVPAVVTGVSALISIVSSSFFYYGMLITPVFVVAYHLIFGYWFIKYLKVN